MNRRTFLRAGAGAAGAASLAGCLSLFDTRSVRAPPLLENRPDAVYIPTHVEGMKMASMASAGPYKVALMYSYPHRFWTMEGDSPNKVSIKGSDSVHMMVSIFDPETKTVLQNGSVSAEISKDGETLTSRSLWQMLSQNMGFHYGDNVALEGNGNYTVSLTIGGIGTRRTGAFEGKFGRAQRVDLDFAFNEQRLNEVMFKKLPDRAGTKAALEPMPMDMPISRLPAKGDLPGEVRGEATSGDARFLVTLLENSPLGDGKPYLAVSPRTPYNRYPLPFMALKGTLTRGGETVFDGALTATLDPDLKYHYGASVEGVESGDELTITVQSPPQVARHEGYETAFVDMPEMTMTL